VIGARKLLFSVILAVAATGTSRAATYYVTQSGAGSQNGTSLANAWSVAQYNANSAPAGGDTVLFSGTITSQIVPNTNGNSSNRLTLDFTGATINVATSPEINISSRTYIVLNGGTFASTSSGTLIRFSGYNSNSYVTVQGMSFTGSTNTANVIFLDATGGTAIHLIIQNNHVDSVTNFVVAEGNAAGTDFQILNNYARSSIQNGQQVDVVYIGDTSNVVIQGNILINRAQGNGTTQEHNDVMQTYCGNSCSGRLPPSGWIIRYNFIAMEFEAPINSTPSNSWSMFENFSNGSAGFSVKAYSNVFYCAQAHSCHHGYGTNPNSGTTEYFHNNTIIAKNGPDSTLGWVGSGTLYMSNNVAQWLPSTEYSVSSGVSAPSRTFTGGHNFWYQSPGSTCCTGTGGSTSTNPQFVDFANDNFALASGSPLQNAGDSTIGAEYHQGICPGATWPNPALCARSAGNWDVGAYQSGSAPTPTGGGPMPPGGLAALVK
jgi:hypothetical protein